MKVIFYAIRFPEVAWIGKTENGRLLSKPNICADRQERGAADF